MPDPDASVTVSEFARLIGHHEITVRGWCRTGRVAAARIGRRWIIPASEVRRLLTPRSAATP